MRTCQITVDTVKQKARSTHQEGEKEEQRKDVKAKRDRKYAENILFTLELSWPLQRSDL